MESIVWTRRNVTSSWLWRLTSLASSVLILRMLSDKLPGTELAFLIFLQGLSILMSFSDWGLSNAVMMLMSKRQADHGRQGNWLSAVMPRVVGRTLRFSIGWLLAGLFYCQAVWVSHGIAMQSLALVFALHCILGLLNGIVSLPCKIYFIEGRGYIQNYLGMAASLTALSAYFVLIDTVDPLQLMLFAVAVDGITVLLANTLLAIFARRRSVHLGVAWTDEECAELFNTAQKNLGVMFASAIILNLDYLLVGLLSSRDVLQYGIIQRVMGVTYNFHNATLMSLWPNFAKLGNNSRFASTRLATRCALTSGSAAVCTAAILSLFNEDICAILIPGQLDQLEPAVIIASAAYYALRVATDAFNMPLVARNHITELQIGVGIHLLAYLVVMTFVFVTGFNIVSMISAFAIAYAISASWYFPWVCWKKEL